MGVKCFIRDGKEKTHNQCFVDKGDFLALIQRKGEKDGLLAKTLQSKWKMINQSNKFKLVDFRLNITEVPINNDQITPAGWKIV